MKQSSKTISALCAIHQSRHIPSPRNLFQRYRVDSPRTAWRLVPPLPLADREPSGDPLDLVAPGQAVRAHAINQPYESVAALHEPLWRVP